MARRSPTESHSYWGSFALPSALPNVLGSSTQNGNLEAGDTAFSVLDATLYVCLVETERAAVWSAIGAGSTRVYNATPSGQIDGQNVDFQLPTFVNGSQALFLNGVRLTPGEGNDYSTAESGGVGTGFDLVQLAYAPTGRDRLLVDYEPVQ
jgi:hypothetical protein